MGQGRPLNPGRKRIWIDGYDYQIIKALADARRAQARTRYAPVKETHARLLEIAYECLECHGADFAKPAHHHEARERFSALAKRAGVKGSRRPAHRPKGAKDRQPRKRRAA